MTAGKATNNRQQTHRKASDIYKKQNILIHKAMSAADLPYKENKEMWLDLFTEIRGRRDARSGVCTDVSGLSDLTLAERHQLIIHFQKQGMKLFSPSVPVNIRDWKKGDEDIYYEFRKEEDPQVAMVFAMWEEMGYKRKTLYGLCFKKFKKNHPRWLSDRELSRLVNIVKQKAQSRGMGMYYRTG